MADHRPYLTPRPTTGIRPMTVEEEAALRAETRRMRAIIREACGGIDLTETIQPQDQLPKHLKLPHIDKYDGTEDPMIFLKVYVRTIRTHGLSDDHMVQLFPRYLTGIAAQWFWGSDVAKAVSFNEIIQKFVDQFQSVAPLEITIQELKLIKQNHGEGFRAFFGRWREAFVQVIDRPPEKELVQMIVWNLQPLYFRHTFAQPLRSLQELIQAGTQIEDAISQGKLEQEEVGSNREEGRSSVNFCRSQPPKDKSKQRKFASWGKPISKVMEKLVKEGHLKPLDPSPQINAPSKKRKLDAYCAFHQNYGHLTDNCIRLRHEIQNLVDNEAIAPPPLKRHRWGQ